MSREKDKIINDTYNYLKFYLDNYNYKIYSDEIKDAAPVFSLTDQNTKQDSEQEELTNVTTKHDHKMLEVKSITDNSVTDNSVTVSSVTDKSVKDNTMFKEDWMNAGTLEILEAEIRNCEKCKLLSEKRTQIVFGTGNPQAKVVIVGEAPGGDEDIQGKPFVGRAGKLLTDILKAINFSRDEVFICNILKCRPPENRNPLPDEIFNCEPYLHKQLDLIKPKLILALGTFASQTLLKSKEPLGKLRGRFHLYNGIKTMVTYHPAALLRNPGWKKPTWEDVQLFRKEYDMLTGK